MNMDGTEKLIKELRALIISSKGGITFRDLNRDFKDLGGSESMYKKIGFSSLASFVEANPNEFKVSSSGLIFAAEKEESSHIQRLVNEQGGKKRSRITLPPPRRPTNYNVFNPRIGRAPLNFSNGYKNSGYKPSRPNPNTDLRDVLNMKQRTQIRPLMEKTTRSLHGETDRVNIVVKRTWPQELFCGSRNENSNQDRWRETPTRERFQQKDVPNKKVELQERPALLQAKAPVIRKPVSSSSSDEDEEIFKYVPPLEDSPPNHVATAVSSQSFSTAATHVPLNKRHTTSSLIVCNDPPELPKTVQPLQPVSSQSVESSQSASTAATHVLLNKQHTTSSLVVCNDPPELPKTIQPLQPVSSQSVVPPPPVALPTKNPAANRLARLQSQVQQTEQPANTYERLTDLSAQLDRLCKIKNISLPEVEVMSINKASGKVFTCLVKIGDVIYASDGDNTDPANARIEALQKAFDALSAESKLKPSLTDKDACLFITRLKIVLQTKPTGIWLDSIPMIYKREVNEEVPYNWEDIIKSSDEFGLSTALERLLVHPASTNSAPYSSSLINPTQTDASQQALRQPTQRQLSSTLPRKQRKIADLETPTERYWDLYILNYSIPTEMVARLIGKDWSDRYDDLHVVLDMEMLSNHEPATSPEVGEIYAVFVDNGWERGRLESILSNKLCQVYLIDEGEYERLPLDMLYELDDKYLKLAPQAFKIALNGLEGFPDLSSDISGQMLRRICVAEILEKYPDQPNGVLATVELWDTGSEVDININLRLMELAVATLADPAASLSGPQNMIICHLDSDIYVQNDDNRVACISCLIEYIMKSNTLPQVTKIMFDKVYLTLSPFSRKYVRAKVREITASATKALVVFCDYGFSCEVDISNLFEVEEVCLALTMAPAQAVKVTLSDFNQLSEQQMARLRSLADTKESLVVKALKVLKGVPNVTMHRYKDADKPLQNINVLLKAAENEREPESPLPVLTLPAVGSCFGVRVTFSPNPGHFMVQFADHIDTAHSIMEQLQISKFDEMKPLDHDFIKCGNVFAVLFTSNWYRGEVILDMGNDYFFVKLCDFGQSKDIPISNIRQLPPNFLKYPGQAVRATLANIVPVNGDWSPTDTVYFEDVVLNKDLAAILKGITHEVNEPILQLQLVDTSGEDDVDIGALLVKQNIAVFKK